MNYRKKNIKIVFFGDSITVQGASWGGYIKRILQFLRSEGIEDKYDLTGAGINGNKVTDLYNRVAKDVLSNGADVVVIFIGINDVWHKANDAKGGTDATTFEEVYNQLIEKLQAASIKVVVCTPTVIGERLSGLNEQDNDLELYAAIIRSLSEKHDLPLIDLRKAFTEYLAGNNWENNERGVLTVDGVHLNSHGNELVADEMWKVLQQVT